MVYSLYNDHGTLFDFLIFLPVCIVQEHVWNLIAKTDYFKAAFNHVINP